MQEEAAGRLLWSFMSLPTQPTARSRDKKTSTSSLPSSPPTSLASSSKECLIMSMWNCRPAATPSAWVSWPGTADTSEPPTCPWPSKLPNRQAVADGWPGRKPQRRLWVPYPRFLEGGIFGGWPRTTNLESFKLPSIERGSFRTFTTQNNAEGAPGSQFEPGSWGCFFSSLFHVDRNEALISSTVESPTAPPPISRMFHQPANHWIRVHVIQLFSLL